MKKIFFDLFEIFEPIKFGLNRRLAIADVFHTIYTRGAVFNYTIEV